MTVNDWFVIAILASSLLFRDWIVAGIMLATVIHSLVDHAIDMSGYTYYITSAIVDAVSVFAIARLSPVKRNIKIIQACCLSFIAVHIFGFVIWYRYEPPIIYNAACSVIYASMLVITVFNGGKRVRVVRGSRRGFLPSITVHAGQKVVREHEGFTR